ncbi:L-seryl-tRNA(Sec) selenium transferase [Bacillus marasmi]|uniref:L-seryl-tRNA(Sec) selenium transferase n=1 Tax=Bacillus marasmi TaxID=1926279 RepID=UPI0011C84AAD|nr:L-seryl-tRNA(Sec) selenium transferase [Bacillus marasmi]
MKHLLRSLPPVHELQKDDRFSKIESEHKLETGYLTEIIKQTLDSVREEILTGTWKGAEPGTSLFLNDIFTITETQVKKKTSYTLKRVINATGTILHTNLGRARLSDRATEHVVVAAQNYSNLEYKIQEGERGSRHTHVETLIKEITGAEAAMVVNNNAAAVYLVLRALAFEKEVIVSRGQLVEIGGSFRISSIMEESGAKLIEVGTTNKTHLYDYENAISDQTAMLLKVHTSNFKTIGFTKSVETEELVNLSQKHEQVIFYEDLGSGVLYDFRKHGIGDEPVVGEVLRAGADIVSFSGDKLLGGPQAGIIAGKKALIDRLKKHQLARVLRVDKMTLAALEGTLIDYVKGGSELRNIPTIRDLLITQKEIQSKGVRFIRQIHETYQVKIIEGTSQVGGGTMPDVELPTYVVGISHPQLTAEQLARKLRTEHSPAIIVRIQNEEIQLDLRTVTEPELELILIALKKVANGE